MDNDEIFGTVTPVTDEKQDMIDFGLLENDKDAQHIDHDLAELTEDMATLEGFSQVLENNKWDGISKQTASVMLVGLKRIDERWGQKSTLVASLEEETNGDMKRIGQEKSAVSKEGIGARAKELWAKFVELIKRAIAATKAKLLKVKEALTSVGPRLEKLFESFENWSPNDANGGKKITVPGKLVRRVFTPEGEFVDPTLWPVLDDYIHKQIYPILVKLAAQLRGFTGKETLEEVIAKLDYTLPSPPSNLPGNVEVTVDGKTLSFSVKTEAVDKPQQVRQASDIRKYIRKAINASNHMSKGGTDPAVMDAALSLISMNYADMIGGADQIQKLRGVIEELNKLHSTAADISLFNCGCLVGAFDICKLERGEYMEEPSLDDD